MVLLLVCFVAFGGAESPLPAPTVLEEIARVGVGVVLSGSLGVPVVVDRVRLDVKAQVLELRGLKIGNPKGYGDSEALTFDAIRVEADPQRLFSEEPLVRLIDVAGASVNAVVNSHGINLKELSDHAAPRRKPAKGIFAPREKRWRIERAVLNGCAVDITTDFLVRNTTHKTFEKMEWRFDGGNGEGVTANEAVATVLRDLADKAGLFEVKGDGGVAGSLMNLLGK